MKTYPLVSIVTPAYRAEYFIKDMIKNLSSIRYSNYEVIMVFDPSPDKGAEIAKEITRKRKNWRIIENKKHLGISKSLNLGVKLSRGKYIIFVMTDMVVEPTTISSLVKYIEEAREEYGGVVAKTYDFHKRNRIQAYRMYLLPQTGYLYIPEYGLLDNKKFNKPFEGFCGLDGVLFKTEVFKKVGLFDLDISEGINDLDMMWRIWLAGYKVVRIPNAKVYHWSLKEGRATIKWEYSYAKMMGVFVQNFSLKYLIIYLPQLMAVYSVRSVVTLLQGNPNPIKGWFKSLYWFFGYLPNAFEKRRVIQKNRSVSDEYLLSKIFGKMSLWEFYKHVKWVQENITPKLLTKEANDEKILTFSK